jgi:hypothetical protein
MTTPANIKGATTEALIAELQARDHFVIPRAMLERSLADGAPVILNISSAATQARRLAHHFEDLGHDAEADGLRELARLLSEFCDDVTLRHRAVILSPRILLDSRTLPAGRMVDDDCTGAYPGRVN